MTPFRIWTALLLLVSGHLTFDLLAQRPGNANPPPSQPPPRPQPPSVRDHQVDRKLDQTKRQPNDPNGKSPAPSTPGTPAPGGAKGGGVAGGGVRPEIRAADRSAYLKWLESWRYGRKGVRDEIYIGKAAHAGPAGTEEMSNFLYARRINDGGREVLLFRVERPDDLPPQVIRIERQRGEITDALVYRPEDKKVRKLENAANLLLNRGPALLLDLVIPELPIKPLTLFDVSSTGDKTSYVLEVKSSGDVCSRLSIRRDHGEVSRYQEENSAGDVLRLIEWMNPRYHGVYRRMTSLVVRDEKTGRSSTLLITRFRINPSLPAELWEADHLAEFLKFEDE